MRNNSKVKTLMPVQEPFVRNKNFDEVELGYTEEMAVDEANRCLRCKKPSCVSGCPVHVRIPEFISAVAERDFVRASEIIYTTNSLPAISGRVCPQERQCESHCILLKKGEAVAIGRLERFVADWSREHKQEQKKTSSIVTKLKKKVAVIGSGPSSLTCAGDLAKMGYDVTIFEAFHRGGGVFVYGIPEFRLPKAIVQEEIEQLLELGVELETNVVVGKTLSVDDLFEDGFLSIFIGVGAGLPNFLNIEGEHLSGVYASNEYLTRINLMKAYEDKTDTQLKRYKKIVVVGGGNVAMDAARCAKRMGTDEVSIVYRRSEEELPARRDEVHHAKEEDIQFKLLTNPIEILGDENDCVRAIKVVKMELGQADESGRRRPVAIKGSEYEIEVDAVIVAVGTSSNPILTRKLKGLELSRKGTIVTDEKMATSLKGIYAGGDVATGAATVIQAMGAGKIAAHSIDEYIRSL